MASLSTEVLVIGGGATGAGVAWDAALRGFDVVLVDRLDLAEGTSGRFHGLLHSGGRYAVKDPSAAVECVGENRILRRVAADCIEDTGGYFVTTPWDDPAYADRFAQGCRDTDIDCEEIPVAQALREEPRLNPKVSRVFRVPDANIDVWKTVWALARGVQLRGGQILPYRAVVDLHRDGDEVTGARVRDTRTGEELEIEARITVNASGAWAGQVAEMAGIEGVRILPGRGIMIAMNHRLVNTVVNRCQMPTDGDIIVPIRTVCVIGTTDEHTDDPDDHTVHQTEVDAMLDDGEKLVPGFRQARALRVWTGVRPLFEDAKASDTETRDVTRAHALLDHASRDGVGRFLDDHRRQADHLPADGRGYRQRGLPAARRGPALALGRPSRSPAPSPARPTTLGERLARKEGELADEQTDLRVRADPAPQARGGDPAARPRPTSMTSAAGCGWAWARARAASASTAPPGSCTRWTGSAPRRPTTRCCDFLQERWKGVWPILYGDQLRQARLDDWIFQGVLDVEHLP